MSETQTQALPTITPKRKSEHVTKTEPFDYSLKPVKNRYKFQFFIDYGAKPGPWLAVGIQSTAYAIGWLPKGKRF